MIYKVYNHKWMEVKTMTPLFPRVQEVENIFHKILASKEACARLRETFNSSLEDFQGSEELNNETFSKVVLDSYSNQDISALLLAICGKSMFDLLRDAYLIPQTFHGKAGENPVLLTSPSGDLLEGKDVSHHTMRRFKTILSQHQPVPRSLVYLADGYDIERYYKHDGSVDQRKTDAVRGILLLYALPDTKKLHLTPAQVYAIIWDTFFSIQKEAPLARVYYGQETGEKNDKDYDEIAILLPSHLFRRQMVEHMEIIDGLVLSCREKMMAEAGNDSLEL
jgi:hypothetical protein